MSLEKYNLCQIMAKSLAVNCRQALPHERVYHDHLLGNEDEILLKSYHLPWEKILRISDFLRSGLQKATQCLQAVPVEL